MCTKLNVQSTHTQEQYIIHYSTHTHTHHNCSVLRWVPIAVTVQEATPGSASCRSCSARGGPSCPCQCPPTATRLSGVRRPAHDPAKHASPPPDPLTTPPPTLARTQPACQPFPPRVEWNRTIFGALAVHGPVPSTRHGFFVAPSIIVDCLKKKAKRKKKFPPQRTALWHTCVECSLWNLCPLLLTSDEFGVGCFR